MKNEIITCTDDVLVMLDVLLKEQSRFDWDSFYHDRKKNIPFFVNAPDENLVEYFEKHLIKPGKVLELGCGPGRNAIYFAEQGCLVDAIDLSANAIRWGRQRAMEKEVNVNFICHNIFEYDFQGTYDIIYDSGCFHHIAPHRRISYLNMLHNVLKPGGYFAITCFELGGRLGGADMTDWDVYRNRSLKGGLGFTEEALKTIFQALEPVQIRKMKEIEQPNSLFGVDALWNTIHVVFHFTLLVCLLVAIYISFTRPKQNQLILQA